MGESAPGHIPTVCAKPAFWHLMLVPTLSISLPASIVEKIFACDLLIFDFEGLGVLMSFVELHLTFSLRFKVTVFTAQVRMLFVKVFLKVDLI